MIKPKTTIVLALSAGTIAFCGWRFYVTYKQVKEDLKAEEALKKAIEDEENAEKEANQAIMIDEVQELLSKREKLGKTLYVDTYETEDEEIVETKFEVIKVDDIVDEDDFMDEEESELRYEPNSREALNQFIMMYISDIRDPNVCRIMDELFKIGIELDNRTETVWASLVDTRADFFGAGTKWVTDLSIADLFIHYATMVNRDLDDDFEDTILTFMEHTGIYDATQVVKYDVKRLNVEAFIAHEFWNEGLFGMFGLDEYDVNVMIDDSIRTKGNRVITFQQQYNKYLEAWL